MNPKTNFMNPKTSSRLFLTAAALFILCPSAPAAPATAPAVTLRYKFAVGQVHRYQYDMAMHMLMETGQTGAGIPIDITMQMVMRQTVKSIRPADGAATMSTQIESLHLLRNGQPAPLPASAQEKIKQPFTQVMLPTGKILFMGTPAFNGMGTPGMDFSKGMLGSMATFPAGPLKVGDTWHGAGAAPMMGLDVASVFALTDLGGANRTPLATIQSKQSGTISKTLSQGMPVPMKMQGQLAGQAVQTFDTSAGAIQSVKGTSRADMLMKFIRAAGQAPPPGMPSAVKMQMQMKFQMQRLSDTPAQ